MLELLPDAVVELAVSDERESSEALAVSDWLGPVDEVDSEDDSTVDDVS